MATKQPLPTNPLLGLDLNALIQMQQQQAQQVPGGPLISYAPGFGPQDNLFGEQGPQRQTNNPNAVPVGGGGLDPALRRIVEQNMGTGRLDISGNRVDPLKPTGLDWLKDNAGRGQVHSWDQPKYPNLNGNQAGERNQLAQINRANTEQTVYDQRGQSIRTPYGTGSNVPMGDIFGNGVRMPEGGTGRLPIAEGNQLTNVLGGLFNDQASTPRPAMPPSVPSNFDLTVPQQIPPSSELQRQQSFDPNQSLWQKFQRGEFDPQQGPQMQAPPLGQSAPPVFAPTPTGNEQVGVQQSGFDPQTQEAVNYFTQQQPQPGIMDLLKQFILAQYSNRGTR